MSGVDGVEGEASKGPSARGILNTITVLVGLPLTWSFLAGMYFLEEYDPLYLAARQYGYQDRIFWVFLLLAGALVMVDMVLAKYDEDFKDDLYNILKEIGEHVKGGMAVEAAVQKAVGWKSSPPAKAYQEALEMSQQIPFEAALRKVAKETGQRSFDEVAELMAMAVHAGGDIGTSMRWLGGHFSTLRSNEKRFTASIEGSLMTMRIIGLLAAPFLYMLLEGALDRNNSQAGPLDPFAVAFFVYGAIGMGSLDGIVYDRWVRVPAKLPLFIGLIRLSLGFW